MTKDEIREVFLEHGFTIKDGQTDLRQYVYDAAYALLEQQRAVPDGYVLVPAQPSIAMCINGAAAADNEINGHAAAQVYAAMLLAAAPATQHTETK